MSTPSQGFFGKIYPPRQATRKKDLELPIQSGMNTNMLELQNQGEGSVDQTMPIENSVVDGNDADRICSG